MLSPIARASSSAIVALSVLQPFANSSAQDSLRIIELSQPGESAPLGVPAGYAFTFSLFSPESASADVEGAVGIVSYDLPNPYTYESKFGPNGTFLVSSGEYSGWYLGPAKVSLRSSSVGARMQLYMMKLPAGVVSGILYADKPTHTVEVPRNALLTPLLGFDTPNQYTGFPQRQFLSYLSLKNKDGVTYGISKIDNGWGYVRQAGTPRIRGLSALHNPNALGSRVVRGFYYDDLDSLSPTADFVGPGTATLSLPPDGERSTPISFYCYRLTKANATFVDSTPPIITVTQPASGSDTTAMASYIVSGAVTDDVHPPRISFRMRSPNNPNFGNWAPVNLAGANATKNWSRTISLSAQGAWQIEIQAFDAANNGSEVRSVSLTRQ